MAFLFKGGVHPYEGKELSKDKPTQALLPKGDLVFPMRQHMGAEAKPIVKKGDEVKAGQIIGEAQGFFSANVICSVSGKVKAIEPRQVVSGERVMSVVVENDGQYTNAQGVGKKNDYRKLSSEQILKLIKDAGIVGMGGAGFPTHMKLTVKDPNKVEYIIVNGAECEPYLTSDYRMMMEEPKKIVEGLKVVLSLFPKAKGVIAIEDNKLDAIGILQKLVEKEKRINVETLRTRYPQGAERLIVYAVTKREINSRMLPLDAGCIVDNIDTIISIYMAVCESTPLMRRIITVSGDAIHNPANYSVKIGTNHQELVDASGGFKVEPEKILSGAVMMGNALSTLDVPITKPTSAIICLSHDEVADYEPTACIRCGKCVEVCPSRIMPEHLIDLANNGEFDEFLDTGGSECCACGCCSYICPAKRPLAQTIKTYRLKALEIRKSKNSGR